MCEIEQKNREFSQYYAELKVIATNLDRKLSAFLNTLRSRLSEEMNSSITYIEMPGDLPAFITTC